MNDIFMISCDKNIFIGFKWFFVKCVKLAEAGLRGFSLYLISRRFFKRICKDFEEKSKGSVQFLNSPTLLLLEIGIKLLTFS